MATTFFPAPVLPVLQAPMGAPLPLGPVSMEPAPTAMAIEPNSLAHTYGVGRPTLLDTSAAAEGTVITVIAGTVYQPVTGVQSRIGMLVSTLTYHDQMGSQSTASFETVDLDGVYSPDAGDEVVITQVVNGLPRRLFGGIIDKVQRRHYARSSQALITSVNCVGYGVLLERYIAHKHYDFSIVWSIFTMVNDLILTFAPASAGLKFNFFQGSGDQLITELVSFNYVTLAAAIKQLCEPASLDFQVDAYGGVHVFSPGVGYTSAPYSLDDNSDFVVAPHLEESNVLRANRIYARPSRGLPLLRTDSFTADGATIGFITDYVIEETTKPLIEVNGVVIDPGLIIAYNAYGVPSHLFSYVPNGYGVFSNPNNAPYVAGTIIEVTYPHPIPTLPFAEDTVRIAAEGLSEMVIEVKDVQILPLLVQAAEGALERLKNRPATLRFETRRPGFAPGQTLTINWTQPAFPIYAGTLVITQVSCTERERVFWYSVEATNQLWTGEGNAVKTWEDLYARSRGIISHAGEPSFIKLSQTLNNQANPGTVPGVVYGVHVVQDEGIIEKLTWIWDSPPATEDITVDIFLNGTSILGTTKFTYAITDTGAISRISFTSYPLYVEKGDQITAEILSGTDVDAKDGSIQINIIR